MRGTLVRRSKGSWSIKLELGKDPKTGKRTQKWITVRGNKKEAEAELARHVNDVNTGGFVAPAKLTVADYLDKWLAYAVTKVSRKTFERYESIVTHHLKPALGALKLPQLTPLHIQDHYTRALTEGRKDGRAGGLSAQTVLHHHRVLSEALKQAVGWQLLARNPAAAVEPPPADAKEAKVIDESESAFLLEAAQGTRLYIPIMMALALGARRGEILAVRWSDFNPFKATLNINRSLDETKAGGVQFKTTKGKRSRPVAIPAVLVEALEAHRAAQDEIKAGILTDYIDNDLICPQPDGAIWRPSAFTSSYRELLKRRGLSGPNFHALRHSHASHLIKNGVDIKQVSARLGHAKAGFTLNTYVHLLPGQDQEAASRVDVSLRKAIEETREKKRGSKPVAKVVGIQTHVSEKTA